MKPDMSDFMSHLSCLILKKPLISLTDDSQLNYQLTRIQIVRKYSKGAGAKQQECNLILDR